MSGEHDARPQAYHPAGREGQLEVVERTLHLHLVRAVGGRRDSGRRPVLGAREAALRTVDVHRRDHVGADRGGVDERGHGRGPDRLEDAGGAVHVRRPHQLRVAARLDQPGHVDHRRAASEGLGQRFGGVRIGDVDRGPAHARVDRIGGQPACDADHLLDGRIRQQGVDKGVTDVPGGSDDRDTHAAGLPGLPRLTPAGGCRTRRLPEDGVDALLQCAGLRRAVRSLLPGLQQTFPDLGELPAAEPLPHLGKPVLFLLLDVV